jgi:glycosyltransferase involved in cell wall biosynthesis
MLLNHHELRSTHGRAARAYAEATFGIENIIERFVAILYRVNPDFALAKNAQSAIAS